MKIDKNYFNFNLASTLFSNSNSLTSKSKEATLLSSLDGGSGTDMFTLSGEAQLAMMKAKYETKQAMSNTETDVGSVDNYIKQGDKFLQIGIQADDADSLEKAAESYRASLEINSDNPLGHDRLGTVLLKQGKNDEAIESFKKAVELVPKNTKYLNNLASAYHIDGNYSLARETYEKAQKINPQNTNTMFGLARTVAKQGDTAKAQEILRKVVSGSPTDPKVLTEMGKFYQEQGDTRKAAQYYRAVAALQPNDLGSVMNIYGLNTGKKF